jgi:hypothetical protein
MGVAKASEANQEIQKVACENEKGGIEDLYVCDGAVILEL